MMPQPKDTMVHIESNIHMKSQSHDHNDPMRLVYLPTFTICGCNYFMFIPHPYHFRKNPWYI